MFEKEIKFINDLTVSKLKGLGEFISLEQIKSVGIHPAVVKYIEAEIDYLIYEDRLKLLKTSIFDYSGNAIEEHFKPITVEIKKNKKFSQEYINKLVLHSISFNLNFLTKPNWSISRFLFDGSEEKNTSDILNILNYLYYYDYLKKIISSYLVKKNLLKFSKPQLEQLMIKIDQVGNQTDALPIIETAVKSISDFVNYYEFKKTSINLNTVQLFLNDKNYTSVLDIVNRRFQKTNINTQVEPVELLATIKYEFERPEKNRNIITNETTKFKKPAEKEFQNKKIEKLEPEVTETDNNALKIQEEKAEKKQDDKTIPEQNKKEIVPEIEIPAGLTEPEERVTEEIDTEQKPDSENVVTEKTIQDCETEILKKELQSENGIFSADLQTEAEKEEIPTTKTIISDEIIIQLDTEIPEELFEEIGEEVSSGEIEIPETEIESNEKPEKLDLTKEMELFEQETEKNRPFSKVEPDKEIVTDIEENNKDPFSEFEEEFEELENKIENSKIDLKVPIGNSVSSSNVVTEKEEPDNEIFEEIVEIDKTKGFVVEEKYTTEKTFEEDKIGNAINSSLLIDKNKQSEKVNPEIDIADLLEHKKMTRIIEVIFDYDMEDFTNCIDQICECSAKEEAASVLDNLFRQNGVKPVKKEAELFKDMIFEYFERK